MMFDLEGSVRKWRDQVRSTGRVGAADMQELETHLRDSVGDLVDAGLAHDEAFLIAVRRMGNLNAVGEEFAKVSSENLWRQMVLGPASPESHQRYVRELGIVVLLGLLAGVLGKIPAILGFGSPMQGGLIYVKNLSLFALPSVAIYLAWKRSRSWKLVLTLAGIFGAGALLVNLYPSFNPNNTSMLTAIHLPIALWLVVGLAYSGSGWRRVGIRMDLVRFTGEAFIYAVLIVCGGVVLTIATAALFELVGLNAGGFIENYLVVFGGLAVPIVAVFLVERKKTVIENIAPVLARIFTPLFLALILSVVIAVGFSGGLRENRDVLISLDMLLVVVLALVLYTMSARDEDDAMRVSDWLTLGLLVATLILDAVSLSAIIFRLKEYGWTPNKVAALGENILVLSNVVGLVVGYGLFALGKINYRTIIAGQMKYLPVYFVWTLFVALAFPPLFRFM